MPHAVAITSIIAAKARQRGNLRTRSLSGEPDGHPIPAAPAWPDVTGQSWQTSVQQDELWARRFKPAGPGLWTLASGHPGRS
jgi:hypothetical protein